MLKSDARLTSSDAPSSSLSPSGPSSLSSSSFGDKLLPLEYEEKSNVTCQLLPGRRHCLHLRPNKTWIKKYQSISRNRLVNKNSEVGLRSIIVRIWKISKTYTNISLKKKDHSFIIPHE